MDNLKLIKAHQGYDSTNQFVIHRFEFEKGLNFTFYDSSSLINFIKLSQFSEFPEIIVQDNYIQYMNFEYILPNDSCLLTLRFYIETRMNFANLDSIIKTLLIQLINLVYKVHALKITTLNLTLDNIFVHDQKIFVYFPIDMHCVDWIDDINLTDPVVPLSYYEYDYLSIGWVLAQIFDINLDITKNFSRNQLKQYLKDSIANSKNQEIRVFEKLIMNYILITQKYRYPKQAQNELKRPRKCIFCENKKYTESDQKLVLSCGHWCHNLCFTKEMTFTILQAKNYNQICCPGNNISLQCRAKGIACSCKVKCTCEKNKFCVCQKPKFLCNCYNGTCKYINKICYCKNINRCKCLPKCKCQTISLNFFIKNKMNLNYSILRKVLLLWLMENAAATYTCIKCSHIAKYPFIKNNFKAYCIECPCGKKGPCSFCRLTNCNPRKCMSLKSYIQNIELSDAKEDNNQSLDKLDPEMFIQQDCSIPCKLKIF